MQDVRDNPEPTAELRPGTQRKHVFDHQSGARLIVSRERLDDGTRVVHFSGSIELGMALHGHFRKMAKRVKRRELLRAMRSAQEATFRRLSGYDGEIEFLFWSPEKRIPHWIVTEVPTDETQTG